MIDSESPVLFTVTLDDGRTVSARQYQAASPRANATFICAHGAGTNQIHASVTALARGIAEHGVDVVTFNFPYTEAGRKLPDRAPVLEACYTAVVREVRERVASARSHLFIGGKSMGGRMATHIAAADASLPLDGLVLFGYPFHPPGNPEKRRDAHLPSVRRPVLVIQGSRDTFGTPDEIRPTFDALTPPATLHVVEGGDHVFKVARAGRDGQAAVDAAVHARAAEWMRERVVSG